MITVDKVFKGVALACSCFVALTACSGGDDGAAGAPGRAGSDGRNALIAVVPEPPGSNCASGGSRIDSGLDENASGVLESGEIVGTRYVCNGTSSSTAQSLVQISDEPAGPNCANGGEKFSAGQDSDGDGTLDDEEVNSIGYACNGSSAIDGNRVLMSLVSEPAGSNCAGAGIRISSGPDANRNDTLDGAEIVSTQYVCNGANGSAGAPGQSALIATVVEPAGVNCTYGGTRITAGQDTNGNGTLDAGETTATAYTCNGEPGPGVNWVEVNGNAVQTAANTAYLINNNQEQVVLTLPSAPAVGSVVRISGLGRGGWKIAQQAGQYIVTSDLRGGEIPGRFVSRHAGTAWYAMGCSADCNVILAGVNAGRIYKSTDGGVTWAWEGPDAWWRGFAASANGKVLFAAAADGFIYKGSDTQSTWEEVGDSANWQSVATSSDGRKVVAVVGNGQIHTSTDEGRTWTARDGTHGNWISVASSADGTRLVAAAQGGYLYTSVDSGVSWTARQTDLNRQWWAVASSADGMKLVATTFQGWGRGEGHVFTSNDAGATWTARVPEPGREWGGVASSADGTRILAAALFGPAYLSLDSGVTWHATEASGFLELSVAGSADGTRHVIGANAGGPLLVSTPRAVSATTVGTAGAIIGGQHHAIELQYAGDGKFVVLSHSGAFAVQ